MEDAAQVDVDDGVELGDRHLLQARVPGDAGVVDQGVDAAEAGQRAGDHRIDLRAVGHVDDDADAGGTAHRDGADLRHGGVDVVQVAHDDAGAFARELQGGGQADALGGAGDDGDLVGEAHGQGNRCEAPIVAGCLVPTCGSPPKCARVFDFRGAQGWVAMIRRTLFRSCPPAACGAPPP